MYSQIVAFREFFFAFLIQLVLHLYFASIGQLVVAFKGGASDSTLKEDIENSTFVILQLSLTLLMFSCIYRL